MKFPTWIIGLALCPTMAIGADNSTPCPLTMPAEAITVHAPHGWTGATPSFLRLNRGGLMFGPPAKMAYLVPDKSKSTPTKTVLTFSFDEGDEKWLYCTYSDAVQLARRLPDAATECTVTSVKNTYGGFDQMSAKCNNAARAK